MNDKIVGGQRRVTLDSELAIVDDMLNAVSSVELVLFV
jgi:hypothetical protein